MKIKTRSKILLVEKIEWTELSQDIYMVSWDDDKNLLTCLVLEGTDKYNKWEIVITWKYSLNKLVYKGVDYHFLDEEDVIGTIEE